MYSNKKHKRFDSLMNENISSKKSGCEGVQINDFTNVIGRLFVDDKKRVKKKCKTQGEESI